ncbi:hypothetical protein KFK09_006927 [Dendrobium nobile]|uniref:NB-ARC domain-containing protein n=1 Tax=Dendrobium nobile TaxID=94219 RepID=A0A8T3BSY0_DENNO|nr:hypothetical protein KFK09_006927 [Dendrobium nobile]
MQFLSMEKSMKLFENRVFGSNKNCPERLKNVANDVVMKCGGLPLAIVAIAGVLASMPNLDDHQQWTNLLNNLPSVLETNSNLESMKQVLLLSYNHLPYLIKPCFLYLSIFPEDHLIKRKNLIQLWIAEGLVIDQYAMSAEVVAECYFNEIVSRSLILPSAVDWNGKMKSFQIHDVMLEVLVFKSMEENMVSIFGKQNRTTLRDGNAIRRLSLQVESMPIRCIPNDVNLSKVISLSNYYFQKITAPCLANDFLMIRGFLPRLKLLRVLVLESYVFFSSSDTIGFFRILSKLRHLRYLSLKGSELLCSEVIFNLTFSKYLSKLQNLVTLDIRVRTHIYDETIPKRLLLFDLYWKKNGLLRNLKDLQTLVGLKITNMKMAKEIGFLTQLRMLEIIIDTESSEIIRYLCVSLEKLSESLLSLSLYDIQQCLEPPENLNLDIKNFPHLLQSFKLRGRFKLPNWVSSLSNLAKLTFTINVKQLDNDLGVMKTLPNLRCLTLTGMFYMSIELLLFAEGGFRNLMMLQIYEMPELRSIEFQVECMPVLKKLVIKDCKKLTRIFDIEFLPILQEIQHQSVPKEIIEELQLNAEKHKTVPKLTTIEPKKNRW